MVLLSLHLNHTSFLKNPKLISHSNRHLPHQLLAPSLLKNTAINSTYQCITSSKQRRFRIITACKAQNDEVIDESEDRDQISEGPEEEEVKELVEQSIWIQMKEIVLFTGPAIGLWLCGPLMSLIDTAVVGQGSSIELAALGPATVFCDYLSYTFMFLSIATSNMVATALARQDREEVQHHISVLLFIGITCGAVMLLFTRLFGATTLTAFTGPKNVHIVPAANTYVQIRGLAWPFLLVGSVAQSASLGMKDSWGPLKALAAASIINGIGDIILCRYLGYGIAGAAWATLASQVVAAYMMSQTLNEKGFNAYAFSIPSGKEFLSIFSLAAPVFVSLMLKVAFYSLLIYFATSMGTHKIAAHQVMLQIYMLCAICGEPLSQTAQSFMPEMMYGVNRSLAKARSLLKSILTIGAVFGLLFGIVATSVPWLFPYIFTPDQMVIHEMHRILIPYFLALLVTPATVGLEGTLLVVRPYIVYLIREPMLPNKWYRAWFGMVEEQEWDPHIGSLYAGRDLRFLSLSMSGCFCLNALVLLILCSRYGLQGCWFSLAGFQWARFLAALLRLLSPNGILYSEVIIQNKLQELKTA